jgi:predicted ribosome quality control (RQC) complex YloA/Tae2 family protein
MINKPRKHRKFLLQLIKRFNLINYTHSLPWKHNDVNSIPVTDYKFGPEVVMEKGIKNGSFKNAETYNKLLKTTVFEPSCISLITEPVFIERESILTEKTIMSIYSGTLPIWIGSWRCADALRSFGFDVFDDIVDHSYQDLEDPFDRCYHAIERNLNLLQDFDRVKELVQNNKSRFEHNLKLLKNSIFQKTVDQVKIDGI